MFDFIVFFLMFLPAMDLFRARHFKVERRFNLQVGLTCLVTIYFGKHIFLQDKPENYYELLKIERDFTSSQLKKAYREASRIYHPDKNIDVDTTDKFLEVKKAQELLSSEFYRYAYDVFGQTIFDQEENLIKSLEMQKMSKEELNRAFFQQIHQKRLIQACVESVPHYMAWTFASILLVNRSYGRSLIAFICVASCAFEIFTKTNYGVPDYKFIFDGLLSCWPATYTIGEALYIQRQLLPVLLSLALCILDQTLDKLPINPTDPLEIVQNIVQKQKELLNELDQLSENVKTSIKERKDKDTAQQRQQIESRDAPLSDDFAASMIAEADNTNQDDTPCRDQLINFQEKLFKFNNEQILPAIGESMDENEAKKSNETMCTKILKGLITAILFVSMLQFIMFGGNAPRASVKNAVKTSAKTASSATKN